jgi:hypothetical protein
LLEIVTVTPFCTLPDFAAAKIFKVRSENCDPHLPRAVAWQMFEIPHDLATGPRMRGRAYATDYQP